MPLKVKLSKEEMVEFLNSPDVIEVFGLFVDEYVNKQVKLLEKATVEVELSLNSFVSVTKRSSKLKSKASFKNTSKKIDKYLRKNKQPLEHAV